MIKDLESIFKKSHSDIKQAFLEIDSPDKLNISLDHWKRPEGGGGTTFTIQESNFFDNCAVNFSSISGKKLPKAALGNSLLKSTRYGYQAMGVSVISHPKNPNVPSSHMNIRLFCILDRKGLIKEWWAGGGYDLTPFFAYEEDCKKWHLDAKLMLDNHKKGLYRIFSKNCNEYFNIPHRNERRGIGGIFFDNFTQMSLEKTTNMLLDIAKQYKESYIQLSNVRKKQKFSLKDKEFQLYRRGRYAEFNLAYDRGTKFGLESNGRISSILASLPSDVKWSYKKDKSYLKMEKELLEYINRDWNV